MFVMRRRMLCRWRSSRFFVCLDRFRSLRPRRWPRFGIFVCLFACASPEALAQVSSDTAIQIFVTASDDPSRQVTLGSDDLFSLFDELISKADEFAKFEGSAVRASVSYLGVADALIVEVSEDAKVAEIFLPSTGLRVSFDASNPAALQENIETYFREEGSSAVAEFRKEINKRSLFGITDGNPNSSTALLARELYRLSLERFGEEEISGRGGVVSFDFDTSSWSIGALEGEAFFARVRARYRFSDKLTVLGALPVEYRRIGQAKVLGGGIGAGLQYSVVDATSSRPWGLRVMPVVGLALRGSEELAAGGAIASVGLNVSYRYLFEGGKSLTVSGQLNSFDGIPVRFDGFELDSAVDQVIGNLGVNYAQRLGKQWEGVVGTTFTRFFKAAGLSRYESVRIGVNRNLGGTRQASFRVEFTQGAEFEEISLRAGIGW